MADKILVTGGAGFIGSHVAEELIAAGRDVVVLDDLSGGFTGNVPEGVMFIKGSILDTALINSIFKKYRLSMNSGLARFKRRLDLIARH